jgi:hypothetical protein
MWIDRKECPAQNGWTFRFLGKAPNDSVSFIYCNEFSVTMIA